MVLFTILSVLALISLFDESSINGIFTGNGVDAFSYCPTGTSRIQNQLHSRGGTVITRPTISSFDTVSFVADWNIKLQPRRKRSTSLLSSSNNNNDGNDDFEFLKRRLERANFGEIANDAILVTCFVLLRFLVYDVTTGTKIVPGWEVQDVIWLTGTLSSATVLVTYWTIAGLLSRSFESSAANSSPFQSIINVVLCCPIWIATEHWLQFGPPNISGSTLSGAIATGFVSLATWMVLVRTLTSRSR